MYPEPYYISETKTARLRELSQLSQHVESIIYLIHLNNVINSERLYAFRMRAVNIDGHYLTQCLCRTSENSFNLNAIIAKQKKMAES